MWTDLDDEQRREVGRRVIAEASARKALSDDPLVRIRETRVIRFTQALLGVEP
jgi:hypothetical protein